MLFICCWLSRFEASAGERPALATTNSPWNVLAYGGKGEMHGAPICGSLTYFSKSPFRLDFDDDFFGIREADLLVHAKIAAVGAIGTQRIYEVQQTVARADEHSSTLGANIPPTVLIILLERRAGEFCDIYQNQYTYDPRQETDEVRIIDISGVKILKVYETDMRTGYLVYWAIQDHKPLRLNSDGLYTAIRSASPPEATPFSGPLNIAGSHFTLNVASDSQHFLGQIDLQLSVRANEIVVVGKTWIPTSTTPLR